MRKRPNIIFINTDQHTYDAISAYGNTFVRTPSIDRLHKNGVSFMRSYCTDPVCCPARASWTTGLYTTENGVPFNPGHLHEHIPDIGMLLRETGYNAYHVGKWHVPGRDVTESFRTLYFGAKRIGAGGAEYYDAVSTHAVLDFFHSYDEDAPFYLQIGYVNPHDICEYEHNFEEKDVPDPVRQGILTEEDLPPLPANFEYDPDETFIHRVARRDDEALIHWLILRKTRQWSELQWRYLIWNHYRFVEKADHEIGLVLSALEASRFRDNTLVIFSIDHGEAYGQHQMFQKFTLYEESIRVPLIISCLGDGIEVERARFDGEHLVSGVDLFATICDYAGIVLPEGAHGTSLGPLARGENHAWREFAYVESNYWGRSIIGSRYKYITEYKPKKVEDYLPQGPDPDGLGREQFFDLRDDPGETRNLSGDPGQKPLIQRYRARLFDQESRLRRLPLDEGRPRRTVDLWGERLREKWRDAE